MTIYKNFSNYEYLPFADNRILNVGWIDINECGVPTQLPSSDFLTALWSFCSLYVNPTRGFHLCSLCGIHSIVDDWQSNHLKLGSAEIRVFGRKYAFGAPKFIFHYVKQHHYDPPPEFIEAVMGSPRPGTQQYEDCLRAYGIDSTETTDYLDSEALEQHQKSNDDFITNYGVNYRD